MDDTDSPARIQRFWSHVDQGDATACWRWTGGLSNLANFEQTCRAAGMSEPATAAFTIELARRLDWPPVGSRP